MSRDPHLHQVRRAHSLRTRGASLVEIARELGIANKAVRPLLAEYEQRRKTGALFEDIEPARDADLYAIASIPTRRKADGHT